MTPNSSDTYWHCWTPSGYQTRLRAPDARTAADLYACQKGLTAGGSVYVVAADDVTCFSIGVRA